MAVNNINERDRNWFLTINAIKQRNAQRQTTNLDPITYNSRYPWFDEANYRKLEAKINQLGLTWYEKEQAMDELYVKALPIVQTEIKNSDRRKIINEKSYEVSQITDKSSKAMAKGVIWVEELTQQLKEKFNIDPTAPDEEVFNSRIRSIPNGEQLLVDYLNNWDKELLYVWWLKQRPKETWWQKAADFWVWVLQSPWKWGYNILWQWIDKGTEKIAGWVEDMLNEDQKAALYDWSKWAVKWMWDKLWFDTSSLTDADFEEYAQQKKKELEEWTAFNGREATDIRTPLLWEERANNWWTKAWEVVGDLGTAVAMTAPLWAALAPAMAWGSIWEAALLWAAEWWIDTLATQYGTQGNLDVTPTQAVLGFVWGALGWMLTNKLANLPKNQVKDIKKEASQYIEKSIKPTVKGKQSQAAYDQFIDDALDVTDYMSKNKKILEYTDDAWEVIKWELPRNLRETSETLGNMKKYIYDQYNSLAQKAGDAWAKVNLNKLYDKLDDLANNNAVNLANPWLKNAIESYKNQLLQYSDDLGNITIQDAQETMKYYNKILDAYFKNPGAMATDTSKNIVVANLKRWLADAVDDSLDDVLNKSISNGSAASEQYRYWKQLYSKIKTIEDEVSKRALVEARKNTKWLSTDIIDALAWGNIVEWLLTQSPTWFIKWAFMKWINAYNKYLNSPNTQIRNLFSLVDSVNNPSTAWTAIRSAAQSAAPIVPEVVIPWAIETLTNE